MGFQGPLPSRADETAARVKKNPASAAVVSIRRSDMRVPRRVTSRADFTLRPDAASDTSPRADARRTLCPFGIGAAQCRDQFVELGQEPRPVLRLHGARPTGDQSALAKLV